MKVRVLVRARPLLRHEEGASAHTLLVDARKATVGVASRHGVASHAVDAVCGVGAPQEEVFEAGRVDELVRAVLDGFHSTIFAYGQTGSGKTFTMEGYDYSAKGGRAPTADFERTPPHKLGVTPRAVQLLFDAVAERNAACAAAGDGASLRVMCSFVQVYREQVLDLLNPALPTSGDMAARGVPVGLKLRWARGREFFVDNLYVGEAPTAARPPSAGRPGSGGGARATVPRLTAQPTASTFEELDNLASLLRKRAALTAERSSGRPSTAAPR